MKPHRLPEFLRHLDGADKLSLLLESDAPPPTLVRTLWKLEQLGLLRDEVIFSLLAQPPLDPIGLYAGLRKRFPDWPWAFNALNFSVVCILAKRGDTPVAVMTLDLLSDAVEFVALVDGKLQVVATIDSDQWDPKTDVVAEVYARVEKTVEQGRAAKTSET
jgi:hypothetical protein